MRPRLVCFVVLLSAARQLRRAGAPQLLEYHDRDGLPQGRFFVPDQSPDAPGWGYLPDATRLVAHSRARIAYADAGEEEPEEPEITKKAEASKYCKAGGHLDPVCDVNDKVSDVTSDIERVMAHMKEMFANKHAPAKRKPARGRKGTAETAEAAEEEEEVLPEAEREELTAESTESEREELRATDTAGGEKAPAKKGAGRSAKKGKGAADGSKGTWAQVQKALPAAVPDADTAFASADANGDGFLDEDEFAAQVEETCGFTNGAQLFRELGAADDEKLSPTEYAEAFGDVSLEELGGKLREKHGDVDKAWGKGPADTLALAEFEKLAAPVSVSRWNAQRLFVRADGNMDGTLSAQEFFSSLGTSSGTLGEKLQKKYGDAASAFKEADGDGDGVLTKEEMIKQIQGLGIPPMNAEVLAAEVDADQDGSITKEEYEASVGAKAATPQELKEKMVQVFGSVDGAWGALVMASALDKKDFAKFAEKAWGVSNGAALYNTLFGDAPEITHRAFARAMGQPDPWEEYKAAVAKAGTPEEAWAGFERAKDGVLTEEEFLAHATELGLSEYAAADVFDHIAAGEEDINLERFLKALHEKAPEEEPVAAEGEGEKEMEPAEVAAEVASMQDDLETMSMSLQELRELYAKLDKEGKLDVQLEKELKGQIRAMTAFEETAEAVVRQGSAPSAEQLRALEGASEEVGVASEQLAGIVPHGEKWWRYGYEYVFVQCLLMDFVLVTLTVVFASLSYYRGEYVPTPAGTKLVYKWYEELAFMMTVTAIVALFVLGIFFYMEEAVMDLTPQVLASLGAPDLRVPHKKEMFEDILVTTIVYLLVMCLVYYLLMHVLVTAAGEKKAHWAHLDSRVGRYKPRDVTPRASKELDVPPPPRKTERFHRRMDSMTTRRSLYATDDAMVMVDTMRFGVIRDYIVEHLLDEDSPLREAVLQQRDPPSQERMEMFRLSWYFRVNIDECIVQLVTTGTRTWVMMVLMFTVLGAGAAWWGWTYLHMMILIGAMCGGVLGSMYYLSRKQFQHLEEMIDQPRGSRVMQLPNIRTETMLEAMRCGTLLLIYGAVQFIGSAFVWKYYFYANLVFCVFVAVAMLVWCVSWVRIIPLYAAANALGPFSNEEIAKHQAPNVRAALQDDDEWEAAEEEAVQGVIAHSPRPPPEA